MRRIVIAVVRVVAIAAAFFFGIWALALFMDGSWWGVPAAIGGLACAAFAIWLPPPSGPPPPSGREIVMYMDTMIGYRDRTGPPEQRP